MPPGAGNQFSLLLSFFLSFFLKIPWLNDAIAYGSMIYQQEKRMLMPRYHHRQRGAVTLGSLLSGYPLKVGRFAG